MLLGGDIAKIMDPKRIQDWPYMEHFPPPNLSTSRPEAVRDREAPIEYIAVKIPAFRLEEP